MFTIPEQFSTSTKAGLNTQFNLFNVFSNQAVENTEKLINLNINAIKASLEESTAAAQQLLAAKNVQEFFAATTAQTQPSLQKAVAYSRHLASIATDAQAEFSDAAETQIAEANRKVVALVDDVAKNAPAGTEGAIAFFKNSVGNISAGYEQFNKTSKQASEAIEANVTAGVKQFTDAAEKTVSRAKK